MAVKYKVTIEQLPLVDQSPNFKDESRMQDIVPPSGFGWHLEYSFKGELNIYHVWKKGGIEYDEGYENTWSGKGDDINNNLVGEGPAITLTTEVDQSESSKIIEFIPNETYLYGGDAAWDGVSAGDAISVQAIASATPITTSSGDFDLALDGDKIHYVGTGNGTHSFNGVPTVVDNKTGTGYWDIVDGTVTPNPTQTGRIDLYNTDKVVAKLLNHVPVLPNGSNFHSLAALNAWKILPGYKFKFIAHNNSNSVWTVSFFVHLIRRRTAEY